MPSVTRSKSTSSLQISQENPSNLTICPKVPRVLKPFASGDEALRESIIEKAFLQKYGFAPRELQVECVLLLLGGWNAFLLASTGFGKSKVPEMYLDTFAKHNKGMVLVLNPLDALVDNRVGSTTFELYSIWSNLF